MPRPITKNQLADFWYANYSQRGHCCLCGNHGIIDTRGKIFSPAGVECGDIVFCICPNGQTLKRKGATLADAPGILERSMARANLTAADGRPG